MNKRQKNYMKRIQAEYTERERQRRKVELIEQIGTIISQSPLEVHLWLTVQERLATVDGQHLYRDELGFECEGIPDEIVEHFRRCYTTKRLVVEILQEAAYERNFRTYRSCDPWEECFRVIQSDDSRKWFYWIVAMTLRTKDMLGPIRLESQRTEVYEVQETM